jgi:hypothetical protein
VSGVLAKKKPRHLLPPSRGPQGIRGLTNRQNDLANLDKRFTLIVATDCMLKGVTPRHIHCVILSPLIQLTFTFL